MTRLLSLLLIVVLVVAALVVRQRHDRHPAAAFRPLGSRSVTGDVPVLASRVARVRVAARRDDRPPGRRGGRPHLHWDRLAACESSGNWQDTAGYYQGGLQFAPSTWASFHGTDFAARADLASRREQIVVARRVLRRQGWAAWPACSRALGWR